ncbi:MAG TPA: glycosyltransferase [Tepidisphaeraceae bacterium]|nr:glycosyltransferase [Tepidisphaeraceae bacterium]
MSAPASIIPSQTAKEPIAILILGMHRSGTSVVTRLLNLLGADLGQNLLGCAAENQTGFWESEPLVNLHNELLTSAGTSWDDISRFPASWYGSPDAPEFQQRIVKLLQQDFSKSRMFAVKDPRICKLITLWRRVLKDFGARPVIVLPVRNPLEVAASLKERNGFLPAKSMLLWLRYVVDAEQQTRDLPRSVVTYHQVLWHWRRAAAAISRDLGIEWPRASLMTQAEVDDLLRPSLRHHKSDPAHVQSDPTICTWIKTVYDGCLAEERGEHGALSAAVDEVAPAIDDAERAYGLILSDAERARRQLEQRLQTAEESARTVLAGQEANQRAAVELTARLNELQQQHQSLQSERLTEQRDTQNNLAGRDCELRRLTNELEETQARIVGLESQLDHWKNASSAPAPMNFIREKKASPPMKSPLAPLTAGARRARQAAHGGIWRFRRIASKLPQQRSKTAKLIAASGLFDAQFYLNRYPDVLSSGIDPLAHFLKYGADEGRDPHPLFNANEYLRSHPDVARMRMNPLVHYLTHGIREGRMVRRANFRRTTTKPNVPLDSAVNVIIPVYRGLDETRRCIESVIRATGQNSTPHSILVIEDGSPDPELQKYLREMAQQQKIWLVVNEKNLGFVATVNRGMAIDANRDVLLLNSDTEVANDWLDRLRRAAYSDIDVATVTPFSNNATICSFPRAGISNDLPGELSVDEIDALMASTNSGVTVDIPTAVGFAMYIRREALAELGPFDADAFGRGYGEENDFCMRAMTKGWRNVLAADTFVYHVGEVSFAQASSSGKDQALKVLLKRYPTYEGLVRSHVADDPASPFRLAAVTAMLKRSGKPVILAISHNQGGGAEKHISDLANITREKCHTLVLRRIADRTVRIENLDKSLPLEACFDPFAQRHEMIRFLREIGVERIHIHQLLNNEQFLPALIDTLHGEYGIPYDITLHDYFFLAPNQHLINQDGIFIGEPDDKNIALLRKTSTEFEVPASLSEWRTRHERLLSQANRIIAPSHDTARRFRRYFPNLQIKVAYHPDKSSRTDISPRPLRTGEEMRVVLLGALGPEKGINVVETVARLAARRGLPMNFRIIGPTSRKLHGALLSNVLVHGPYQSDELPALLDCCNAHLAWFPSQCPETFSYTLSEAMAAGLPILASDLGAFSERLASRPWSWCAPWNQSAEQWCDLLMQIAEHLHRNEPPAVCSISSRRNDQFYEREFLSWLSA